MQIYKLFRNFLASEAKNALFILRQFQPCGNDVLTLGERGLCGAAIGVAAVVGDGETEGALSAGGQQGDIDSLSRRSTGDRERLGGSCASGMNIVLRHVDTDADGCRLRIFTGITAGAAIADGERFNGDGSIVALIEKRELAHRK